MILGNACTCKETGEERERGGREGGETKRRREKEESNYTYVTGLWLLL